MSEPKTIRVLGSGGDYEDWPNPKYLSAQDEQRIAEDYQGPPPKATALDDLDGCPLHRKTPYGITNVTMTQFSIARHQGGIKFNGDDYTYLPDTDELIRDDVLQWKKKRDKARK